MNKYSFGLLLSVVFLFVSCGSDFFGTSGKGNIVSETRKATDFQSIDLESNAEVTVVRDTGYKVVVQDYENIVANISAKVVSKVLVISVTPISAVIDNSVAKVTVSIPDSLTTIVVAGSGSVNVDTTFKDIKKLLVTGNGHITLNKAISVKMLTAQMVGSGSITAIGAVDSLLVCQNISSGELKFPALISRNGACYNSGSGNVIVNVTDTLKAAIAGTGNVYYLGNPTIGLSQTGSGKLIPYTAK